MVFAVWAARRDFAERQPGLVKDVHEAFLHSRDRAAVALDVRWPPGGPREPVDVATLRTYFETLDFAVCPR